MLASKIGVNLARMAVNATVAGQKSFRTMAGPNPANEVFGGEIKIESRASCGHLDSRRYGSRLETPVAI